MTVLDKIESYLDEGKDKKKKKLGRSEKAQMYIGHGSIKDILRKKGKLKESEIQEIVDELTEGYGDPSGDDIFIAQQFEILDNTFTMLYKSTLDNKYKSQLKNAQKSIAKTWLALSKDLNI